MSANGEAGLAGRRIVLGVTGGIAAYKAPELVRRLRDRGATVQVVMTAGARHFVTSTSLQAVSGRAVRSDLWDEAAEAAMGHIELARWAELVLVAPASADVIARLAGGLASDLLTTLCVATEAPLVLAPAMNRVMWTHPATRDNVSVLERRGAALLGPDEGDQACGEVGAGRMMEPGDIAARIDQRMNPSCSLSGLRVMVTAGPTREALDPVRFLSNRSSGKMGYAVARAAADAGADVQLVTGPVGLATPPGVERIDVTSARDMHGAVHGRLEGVDIFVAAAAVADYYFASPAQHKIKKTEQTMTLTLERAPDVLGSVAALPEPPFTVGFAAETRDLQQHARGKLTHKGLDMIAANLVGDGKAFDCDENALTVYWGEEGARMLPSASKHEIARQLIELIAERYRARGG